MDKNRRAQSLKNLEARISKMTAVALEKGEVPPSEPWKAYMRFFYDLDNWETMASSSRADVKKWLAQHEYDDRTEFCLVLKTEALVELEALKKDLDASIQ